MMLLYFFGGWLLLAVAIFFIGRWVVQMIKLIQFIYFMHKRNLDL